MGKFVRFGNVIVNTDNINCIMDNGGKREIMLNHLSLVTDETFGELLEILNANDSYNCMNISKKNCMECERRMYYAD